MTQTRTMKAECDCDMQLYFVYLPPTTEEVNAIARDICLSVC